MATYYYSKDGITITAILDTRRSLSNGEFPVKIRITYKRKQIYYPTGKSLNIDTWNHLDTIKKSNIISIRKDIENSFYIIQSNAQELLDMGCFSIEQMNIRMNKGATKTLTSVLSLKIENLLLLGKKNTADLLTAVLKNIRLFTSRDLAYTDITIAWLHSFENYLRHNNKRQTTIAIYMRTIRGIFNEARKEGLIKPSQYPFGSSKYEIQEGEGRKLALTLEQIGKIARYDDGNETTAKYRDYWLFLYLCNGINVADFVKLKFSNIINGEIYFVRQKTEHRIRVKKEICVPISSPMQAIINRWGNRPNPDAFIFPILKGDESDIERCNKTKYFTRSINRRMQNISKALGITHISTYTARHSFATVLKRSGANIAYISESLGHQSIKTTENYLANFEREERAKNAELLTRF